MLSGIVVSYPASSDRSNATYLTPGPGGKIWFTAWPPAGIGNITSQGVITEFPTPAGSRPGHITTGPDGNLWFTAESAKVGRMTPDGVVTEFDVPLERVSEIVEAPGLTDITNGPDGNLWFTESAGAGLHTGPSAVGKITPSGTATLFDQSFYTIRGITAGADGNMWFIENGFSIDRITPTGMVTKFQPSSEVTSITAGPDGNIWFAEAFGTSNKVGRITPSGTITEFDLPGTGIFVEPPSGITAGPDGNLWVGVVGNFPTPSQLDRITPRGFVTEFDLPINVEVGDLIDGPDGNLWFHDTLYGKIDQVVLANIITPTAVPVTATAGQPFMAVVSTFTSASPTALLTDFQATVQFADGTSVPGLITEDASHVFSVVASHTFARAGNYPTLVTITNTTGGSAAVATQVSVADGPSVIGLHRLGTGTQPTLLTINFTQDLDAARAQNLQNYRLISLHLTRRGFVAGPAIALRSASYDPASHTVVLRPRQRLPLSNFYVLIISGSAPNGLTNRAGIFLDGAGNGVPGTSFVSFVHGLQ
jgi:virginiamycin B lyase